MKASCESGSSGVLGTVSTSISGCQLRPHNLSAESLPGDQQEGLAAPSLVLSSGGRWRPGCDLALSGFLSLLQCESLSVSVCPGKTSRLGSMHHEACRQTEALGVSHIP